MKYASPWMAFATSSLLATSPFSYPFSEQIQENSLLNYARSYYSQYGEEGVIEAVMRKIGIEDGFFVEFGGYDGVESSNTRFLAEDGWRGVFIEADESNFRRMKVNLSALTSVLSIQAYIIPYEGQNGYTFDEIADWYFPNEEIDVMSIDIDGLDHLILKTLKRKPKLIVIEGGMFWHPMMQLEVPEEIAARDVQQPIIVMAKIAKEQGYELICSTFNSFYIRSDLYCHFADINNDPSIIWRDAFLYIRMNYPTFYNQIIKFRETSWIQEWERKDPNIAFSIP